MGFRATLLSRIELRAARSVRPPPHLALAAVVASCVACGPGAAAAGAGSSPPDGGAGTDASVDAAPLPPPPIDGGLSADSSAPDSAGPVVPVNGPVPPGRYTIHAVGSGKCLDLTAGSLADGALLDQEACGAPGTQSFDVLPVTSKHYRIINAASGRGLDVKDSSVASGGPLQQWTFKGAANQEFTIEPQGDGTFVIRGRESALILEVTGGSGADGAGIDQTSASITANQRWTFEPVAGAPPPGFVRVSGTDLIDGYGYYLLLRGASVANWLEPEGYMWQLNGSSGDRPRRIEARVAELIGDSAASAFWKSYRDTYITEDDIARIADLGFNSIRLPMNARLLFPEGGSAFDEAGFKYIESAVAWCKKHGIYVILDMHCAPGGQTGTNIDDDPNDSPDLFAVPGNQDRLVTLWTELARRYASETAVLGYDLLNEPIAPSFSQYNGQLYPLYQRVGAAIRGVDGNHILIVEGAGWANDWSSLGAPFDASLVYSFHKYWDNTDQASIQRYIDARASWKRPVWVGEIGENDNTWYSAAFPLLELNGLGWAFWPWKKIAGGNDPYDVATPAGWGAVQGFVTDPTSKPTAAAAQATFDSLLGAIPLANATYDDAVVCALLPCK